MLAFYRVVSLTPLALVRFRLACGSGLPLVSCFSLLSVSGLGACRRGPFSLRPPHPVFFVPCVPCFVFAFAPPPVSSVWLGRLVVPCLPVCPLLGDSVAVSCHPIGVLPCFAPSASAFRRSLSARLVSFLVPLCLVVPRPDCRFACFAHLGLVSLSCRSRHYGPRAVSLRFAHHPALLVVRTGRLGVPWFPLISGGSLLGVPFLVVARSSACVSSRSVFVPVVLACFPASVSCGGAAVNDGSVSRCPCVPLAFLLACPASARMLAA